MTPFATETEATSKRYVGFVLAMLAVSGPTGSVQKAIAAMRMRALALMMALASAVQVTVSTPARPGAPEKESPMKQLALVLAMHAVSGPTESVQKAMAAARMRAPVAPET